MHAVIANGSLFRSSSLFTLVILLTSLCTTNHQQGNPLPTINDGSVFIGLNLNSKVYPGGNDGLDRNGRGNPLPPYLQLEAGLMLTKFSLTATALVLQLEMFPRTLGPPCLVTANVDSV